MALRGCGEAIVSLEMVERDIQRGAAAVGTPAQGRGDRMVGGVSCVSAQPAFLAVRHSPRGVLKVGYGRRSGRFRRGSARPGRTSGG